MKRKQNMKKDMTNMVELETRDFVARAYSRHHGSEPSSKKLREITSNSIQAREYFRSAALADYKVQPLLQYYGVASYSRALVLLLSSGISESALKPTHGLKPFGWRGKLSKGLSEVGGLSISITRGLFLDTLKSSKNKSYLKANLNRTNQYVRYEVPAHGKRFSFSELCEKISDLSQEYAAWKDTPAENVALESVAFDEVNNRICLRTRRVLEKDLVKRLFPKDHYDKIKIVHASNASEISFSASSSLQFGQIHTEPSDIGFVCVVPPFNSGVQLNTLGLYFASSFALGTFARYFPSSWVSLGRVARGDSVLPVVLRLLSLIQTRFPEIILEFFRGPYDFESEDE